VPLIRGFRYLALSAGRSVSWDSEKRGIVSFTSPSLAASSAWSSGMCVVRTAGPSPTPDR
jgi:hypothetical protein